MHASARRRDPSDLQPAALCVQFVVAQGAGARCAAQPVTSAGVSFPDKNGINIMKNYMEDGVFSRGKDIINAEGSIVLIGNLDGDIQTIVRTSNLF